MAILTGTRAGDAPHAPDMQLLQHAIELAPPAEVAAQADAMHALILGDAATEAYLDNKPPPSAYPMACEKARPPTHATYKLSFKSNMWV